MLAASRPQVKQSTSRKARAEWRQKLPEPCRGSAEMLWQQLDAQRELKCTAEKKLVAESHRHPITKLLETCPGFGRIRTALTVPVVVTPNRFRTSRQLWSYSGLGIVMCSSSDWVKRSDGRLRAETAKARGLKSLLQSDARRSDSNAIQDWAPAR